VRAAFLPKKQASLMSPDLQGIFDALLEGVVLLDANDQIELCNAEAMRLLGASTEAARSHRLADVVGEDHPLCAIVARVRELDRPEIHDEIDFPRRRQAPVPVEVSVSTLAEDRSARGAVAIALRDRSAARSLREEVSERDRQESYAHIAAGIAHEVKNPLGGIRGAAELLGLSAPNERAKKAAQLIVTEVDRISGLVDELMVFARGEALELEKVNVHQPLDMLLDLLELERGYEQIEVERLYDPSLPDLLADPARLQQIFLNLARNAMQAMEEKGGKLTLATRMLLEHRLVGPDGRPRPTIEVRICDTGPGVAPEQMQRLTTPFFTTKRKGTGLGLSVARHWIRRHGGRMRISSVEGEGTCVYVDLPLEPIPTRAEEPR
jgi:two-component system nitrogen regulation sensor histidine kinase GlnL